MQLGNDLWKFSKILALVPQDNLSYDSYGMKKVIFIEQPVASPKIIAGKLSISFAHCAICVWTFRFGT